METSKKNFKQMETLIGVFEVRYQHKMLTRKIFKVLENY